MGVRAHDIRALSASWAWHEAVPLQALMSACQWKSPNTFTKCYLMEVRNINSKMYELGPLVAAQHIV